MRSHPSKLSVFMLFLTATPHYSSSFHTAPPLSRPTSRERAQTGSHFASIVPNKTGRSIVIYGASNESEEYAIQQQHLSRKNANNKNFFHQLTKSKPIATFLVSFVIFLLPLFLSSDAWAVQSGGRIGGSVGGSSSSRSGGYSSGRSYSSGGYSRGFSQGYSSGYYSRPSVVVHPLAESFSLLDSSSWRHWQ